MAVFVMSSQNSLNSGIIPCVICSERVNPRGATIGSHYANGAPAYASTKHLADRSKWIVSWSLFETSQTETRFFAHTNLQGSRYAE